MAEKGFGVKEVNLIGASGTPTITSPNNLNLNAVNVAISTNATIGGTLAVTGNVSVGGTLTYEDVTNIDSVGVITARSGVDVDDFISVGSNIHLGNAGVVTATTFSGSGASLTSIPAGQLTGTVADARISSLTASKLSGALPAISGANLTNLPAANLTGTLPAISGANLTGITITPTNSDIQVVYTVTANGASAYRFAGNGVVSTADNPDLYFIRGQKYRFINNSGGSHPFQIREASGGTAYSTGVTNNGAASGNIDFAPTYDSPAQLVYQCTSHGGMVGNIYLRDAAGGNTNVGVTTFTGDLTIPDKIIHSGDTNTAIRFPAADTFTVETGGSERLRIASGGQVIIGDDDTDKANAHFDDLIVGANASTTETHGITIVCGNAATNGGIAFSDGSNGGADAYRGMISYQHNDNHMQFRTNGTERLRIDSDGRLLIGATSSSSNAKLAVNGGMNSNSEAFFELNRTNDPANGQNIGIIEFCQGNSASRLAARIITRRDGGVWGAASLPTRFEFHTCSSGTNSAAERFRINSTGQVSIGDAISGMGMGFGNQLLSARSDTYSSGIFGSNGSGLTALIVYADHASYASNLQDWRTVRSNNSAFNFLRCSSNSAADNEFFIGGDGVVYSDGGTTMQSPADYAEMFEWSDGNSSGEDRRGYTVVLDGNKVRIATSSDSTDNIIGVVSGNPAVLADNAWDRWAEKYQKDDYNCYVRNSDGDRILNSSYDDTQTYVPREDRKEWDAIGMVGKLRVRKGQQTGTRWLKMRNVSDSIEEWLVR